MPAVPPADAWPAESSETRPAEPADVAGLAARVTDAAPRLGPVRLVCLDGPAGSGKTTLAAALAERMGEGCAVVHMDDLYEGWAGLGGVWDRVETQVLAPLAQGRPARYRRYDWVAGAFADWVDLPVPRVLVLEGCGSAPRAVDDRAVLRVFVEAPREQRLARGLQRDGEDMRERWLAWMVVEDAEHAGEDTRARADVVVDGTVPLERGWLAGPVLEVAPRLLGAVVRTALPDGVVAVRLTEVEAYDGQNDPGSHAYRGRTARNAVMFGPAGHLYVYRHLGLHVCANVVTGPEGRASAVLLRAGEVVEGADLARERRLRRGVVRSDVDLARGPARLAVALGLVTDHDGADLLGDGQVRLVAPPERATAWATGPRVGVSGVGGDGAAYPWRLWLPGEPTVSAYRAATPRVGRRGRPRDG